MKDVVNFVICDNDNYYLNYIIDIVKTQMEKLKIKIKIYKFNDYDKIFMDIIKCRLKNLIYILDIVTPSNDGISVAELIRKNDIKCDIIFITGYTDEYSPSLLAISGLYPNCTITKHSTFNGKNDKEQLIEAINKSIKNLNKQRSITFHQDNLTISLQPNEIIMISSAGAKNCILLETTIGNFTLRYTFKKVLSILNDDFKRIHKSCIINKTHIKKIDNENKIIYLSNRKKTNLLADDYKKRLKL